VGAAARDDGRPLGLTEQVQRLRDALLGAGWPVAGPIALCAHHLRLLDLLVHDIDRDLEEDRAGPPRHAVAEGHGRELVEPVGLIDDASPLDQRPDDVNLLELLQRQRLGLGDPAAARDHEHG
jgi:hypothetical protein